MTLETLAGSLFWAGFDGAAAGEVALGTLRELAPGGVVLFARNVSAPATTSALAERLRAELTTSDGTVPHVALDQEGGRVARLGRGFTTFPSALALAANGDAVLAERFGAALAEEVRRAGAGVDFAPVADLLLDPDNAAVGTRSLGDDPSRVATLAAAQVRGLQGGGVASVLKHFPGHGATSIDSHMALPRIDAAAATLRARELVPFVAGIAAGALGVMAGHLMVPALDERHPATWSRRILTGLLREELGFTGLCFTDCLLMDAVARDPGTVEAAVAAVAAGADALIVSHDLSSALAARAALVAAVRAGRLPLGRLEEARERGASFRSRLAALAGRRSSEADPAGVARLVAAGAVTLVRGNPVLDPARVVNVVSFEGDAADGIGSRAGNAGLHVMLRERRIRAESLRVPLDPPAGMLETLGSVLETQRERGLVVIARRAYRIPAQARAIEALLATWPGALLVSALEPFDVPRFPQARTVACTFGDDAVTFEALADILSGRASPRGTLPVHLA